ncbi:MAG TPA: bifunctional diaminohydroxyphosphoribosylaminopyrimidine deaminase/5-amino-6-(5-phosphoribosylamino)uracil reductase RibD [Chthoniobacterales bacterium]
MKSDAAWMRLALAEARKGIGKTSPNPAVGAVIVRDGELISRGWHRKAGQPHAEIMAIRALESPELARGATIHVTLEPCSTQGRTPPCVEAIIRHGFARVVIGTKDPNPAHAGRSVGILEKAGIEVVDGILEAECTALNEAFNKWIVTRQPFVIAKCGMSLDGRISRPAGESQWLTSPESRRTAHQLRSRVDAILVGAETVRRDNPRLTIRGVRHTKQPWRVVLSRNGVLPRDAHVFTDEWKDRTLVFSALDEALTELGRRNVLSVLIEGGGQILGAAFDQKRIDRVEFFYAPLLTGGDKPAVAGLGAAGNLEGVRLVEPIFRKSGPDIHLSARVA